jgi:phosphoglycolate phosphatase
VQRVFFDLDGTLMDPVLGITRCIQYALERLGRQAPASSELTWCIGPPLLDTFRTLVGAAQAEQALGLYRERFGTLGWQENAPYPGVPETLTRLSDSGLTLFVATSKPLVYAERIVEHFQLGQYFQRVFGSELDGTRSHKTPLLEYALAETRPRGPATMIGDREHDVIGARNNGMRSISVTYGYGSRSELEAAAPDELVGRPEDLVALLA